MVELGQVVGGYERVTSPVVTIDPGKNANGQFNFPWGIAVGSSGGVYVADTDNDRIQQFNSDGSFVFTWDSERPGGIVVIG